MRIVSVSKDAAQAALHRPPLWLVTGTDESSGDLVTFTATSTLVKTMRATAPCSVPVASSDVIKVEPTSGQWDSPGTSPEDGS